MNFTKLHLQKSSNYRLNKQESTKNAPGINFVVIQYNQQLNDTKINSRRQNIQSKPFYFADQDIAILNANPI